MCVSRPLSYNFELAHTRVFSVQAGVCLVRNGFVLFPADLTCSLAHVCRWLMGEPQGSDDIVSVTQGLFWADDLRVWVALVL